MSSHVAPEFPVRGLEPGVLYTVIIYSSNGKGRSADTAILTVSTLGHSSHQHQRTNKDSSYHLVESILCAVTIVSIVLGSTIGAMIRCKRRHRASSPLQNADNELDKSMAQLLTVTPSVEDERNPDVIPQSSETDFTHLTSVVNAEFIPDPNVPQWEVTLTPAVEYHTVPTHIGPEVGRWVVGGPVSWPPDVPSQPVLLSTEVRPNYVFKQHAETQTPARHKESAV